MTDNEKLQQLFQAALKDTSEGKASLVRAFPSPTPIVANPPSIEPVPQVFFKPEEAPVAVEASARPATNAGLGEAESAELGALLDEQNLRKSRKRRRELIGTFVVLFALTGGGFGWFVHSPARVQAFREAVKDIRSVGDIKSTVAQYQVALDRISARSSQIDEATQSMGVSSNQDGMADPNMDAEMHAMMGGEGKTTGERNKTLQNAFGKKVEPTKKTAPAASGF